MQIRNDGKIISLHPSFIGFWITYSGDIIGSEYDLHAVKSLMIDEWVQGDTDLDRTRLAAIAADRNSPRKACLAGPSCCSRPTGWARLRSCVGLSKRSQRLALAGALPHGRGRRTPARQDRPSRIRRLAADLVERVAPAPRRDRRARRRTGRCAPWRPWLGSARASVGRIWAAHGLQPHRMRTFNSPKTRPSPPSYTTWSGFTSLRRRTAWCCRWTRKARSRRSIGRTPGCR